MNGRERAFQLRGGAQFLERQVGLFLYQEAQLPLMGLDDQGLAPRAMVARADLSGASTLLQEFLHHPERNPVTLRNLLSGPILLVIGSQNPFAQIQRERSHRLDHTSAIRNGYTLI